MSFSYAAAYLAAESSRLFVDHGVDKKLHLTTCFDSSALLDDSHDVPFTAETATIKAIRTWNTPTVGVLLVAELSDCAWSYKLNKHFNSLGAVEDLPHKPHLTLAHGPSLLLEESLQVLVGAVLTFDRHCIKRKSQ